MGRQLHDDVRYCGGPCKKPTMHDCEDTGCERDNYQKCQTCGYHTYGVAGDYVPHDQEPSK
mgnify:CR=1 FL=1